MPSYEYLDATSETLTVGGEHTHVSLKAVIVGTTAVSAVVTVHNGTDTNGDVVATIDAATLGEYHFDGVRLDNGLHVTLTGAAAKVTIVYE